MSKKIKFTTKPKHTTPSIQFENSQNMSLDQFLDPSIGQTFIQNAPVDFVYITVGAAVHENNYYSKFQLIPGFVRSKISPTCDQKVMMIHYDKFPGKYDPIKIIHREVGRSIANLHILIVQTKPHDDPNDQVRDLMSFTNTSCKYAHQKFSPSDNTGSTTTSRQWLFCNYMKFANAATNKHEHAIELQYPDFLKSLPYRYPTEDGATTTITSPFYEWMYYGSQPQSLYFKVFRLGSMPDYIPFLLFDIHNIRHYLCNNTGLMECTTLADATFSLINPSDRERFFTIQSSMCGGKNHIRFRKNKTKKRRKRVRFVDRFIS